ncbi:MAG: NAD(P)H-dependent oxidoreductase [Aggregatilineales bacterium]
MKLLHIIATPRQHESRTLRISNLFIDALGSKYADLSVEELNLFADDLPSDIAQTIETKYNLLLGAPIDKTHEESWKRVEYFISGFVNADVYVVTSPMWNFSIPYALKYYIDSIVQPGYLFKFNEMGRPEGLIHGKKMVCVTSSGSDFSQGSPMHAFDFQEPYLRAIFGFVGITDIQFISAQPLDITPDIRNMAMIDAAEKAKVLGMNFEWNTIAPAVV